MFTRIIASLILLPLFIFVLIGGIPLYVLEVVLIIIGMYEFYKAFNEKNIHPIFYIGYIFAVYLGVKNILKFSVCYSYYVLFILFLIGIIYMLKEKHDIIDIVITFLGIFYIGFLFDFIILTMDNLNRGRIYVWLIFLVSFMTDTCAYFVGRFFGKNKLLPAISPKKTVEGCLGGVVGSTVSCLIFGCFFDINLVWMLIVGLIGSVIAQMGDLFASSIKRYVNIKDYGKLIPGHGGFLDRFDSVILVAPFIYNIIKLLT